MPSVSSRLERPRRQSASRVLLVDARLRRPRHAVHRVEVLHVRLRVLVRHDVDGARELNVAVGMIEMRMRVDQRRYRLVVTVLSLSRINWPQPGSPESTITTPAPVTNAATLPPAPRMTNRLSRTFSTLNAA